MFSVTVTDKGFSDAIEAAVHLAVKDFAPELARSGQTLAGLVKLGFTYERDPYGNSWTALSPLTIREKRKNGSARPEGILQDTLKLLNSFAFEVREDGISIYTDRRFSDGGDANIHQFGGIHPRTRSFIPQREMLPFSKDLPPEWTTQVERSLIDGADRIFK